MDPSLLEIYAQLDAQRYLIESILAVVLDDRPDGLAQAKRIKEKVQSMPTQPPGNPSWMDPAMTDVLASITDEVKLKILNRVIFILETNAAPAR